MCGIAGICMADGAPIPRVALEQSAAALAPRGPDGSGIWIDSGGSAALVHTRLAIIDVAGGAQPMANEDGAIQVVFNGEIYNHRELRKELVKRGHRFRTRSDTEILVHLYEEEGTAMFDRLVGMFALAIWDSRDRSLLLGRDRLGQKPLFFGQTTNGIAFASEIKALRPLVPDSGEWNPTALYHYLTFQYVPGDLCAFSGIEKLRPGEWLRWSPGSVTRQRYWQVPTPASTFVGTFTDAAGELRRLLREATRSQLEADVPVGALLSGGLDSSVVVGLMAEAGAAPIRTFTASFGDAGPDERPYARAVARRFATDHHELTVEPPDKDLADRVIDLYDEPFADTSSLATYAICRLARQSVKVALTGDGGDESLLGYERYQQYRRYLHQRHWLDPLLTGSGLKGLGRRLCPAPGPRTLRRRFRTLVTLWDPSQAEIYERWLAAFADPLKARLCTRAFRDLVGSESSSARIRDGLTERNDGDWVAAAGAFDMATYLPDAVLTKVDRASMASGLECRSPFLDHRVVEFLATLPTDWKLHPRHGSKWILRAACADLLPPEIMARGKLGFGSPVGAWFRRQWSGQMEAACLPAAGLEQWLDAEVVGEILAEHRSGTVDHTYRLWTLNCLNRAARREKKRETPS